MPETDRPDQAPALQSRAEVPPLLAYLAQVFERRHFTWALASGNLRGQHLDTLLGNVWHVLNPIFLIGVYFLVFGIVLETDRGVDNFIAFLAIGIFSFSFSQRTVMACSNSISNNQGLIRSLQFPRAVLPLSTVLVEAAGYASGFGVMVVTLLLTNEPPRPSWLLAPVIILLFTIFSAGLGLIVARLADTVRDVSQVIPYLFRVALYVSGIIFSVQAFVNTDSFSDPVAIRRLFVLDPFFTYIDLLRDVLMSSYSAEFLALEWAYVLVTAPLTLLFGLVYFRGGEREYGRG